MTIDVSLSDVRPANNSDVTKFRQLIDIDDGWKGVYKKQKTLIMIKSTDSTSIQMIKVKTNVSELTAEDMYDTLMDPNYRRLWDKNMVEGYDIGLVSTNTDIGYYSMRLFPPFKNRDFVTLRSWFSSDDEYVILNHSVLHSAAPPTSSCVRGISYLSGFLVRKTGPNSCYFCFVTQSDPRGNFPAWAVNHASQFIAPKSVAKLVSAAKMYRAWKENNSPDLKPWIFPDQLTLQPINLEDVLKPNESFVENCVETSDNDVDSNEDQLNDPCIGVEEMTFESVDRKVMGSDQSPNCYEDYESLSGTGMNCDSVTRRNVTPVEMVQSG